MDVDAEAAKETLFSRCVGQNDQPGTGMCGPEAMVLDGQRKREGRALEAMRQRMQKDERNVRKSCRHVMRDTERLRSWLTAEDRWIVTEEQAWNDGFRWKILRCAHEQVGKSGQAAEDRDIE